jgi:hypothetical protein
MTDEYTLKNRVLDAYKCVEAPNQEDRGIEGGILYRTQIRLYNLKQARKRHNRSELYQYYQIAEEWYNEIVTIENEEDREHVLKNLRKSISRRDSTIAERIYLLFEPQPEALSNLEEVCPTSFYQVTQKQFRSILKAVTDYQQERRIIDEFLDA